MANDKKTVEKKVLRVGRYVSPEDTRKPFYVEIEWIKGGPLLKQPCSESELFALVNHIIDRAQPIVAMDMQ